MGVVIAMCNLCIILSIILLIFNFDDVTTRILSWRKFLEAGLISAEKNIEKNILKYRARNSIEQLVILLNTC